MVSLQELKCHFTWLTKEDLQDVSWGEPVGQKLLRYFEPSSYTYEFVPIKRSFAAFIRASIYDETHLRQAMEDAEAALIASREPTVEADFWRRLGFELVALGNKAHIQNLLGDESGTEDTMRMIQELGDRVDESCDISAQNKVEAAIIGARADALRYLLKNEECLEFYRQADRLDPTCYRWPLGVGIVVGRMKRCLKRTKDIQSIEDEEEAFLQKAVDLNERQSHIPLMKLAMFYYYKGRKNPLVPSTQDKEMLSKAEELFRDAYAVNPNCFELLSIMGKALTEIDPNRNADFALKLLLEAHNLIPTSTEILHRLGQFYEHRRQSEAGYAKAEEYYAKAVTSGSTPNLYADVALARIRWKRDSTYDCIGHIESLLEVYTSEVQRSKIQQILVPYRTTYIAKKNANPRRM